MHLASPLNSHFIEGNMVIAEIYTILLIFLQKTEIVGAC